MGLQTAICKVALLGWGKEEKDVQNEGTKTHIYSYTHVKLAVLNDRSKHSQVHTLFIYHYP